MFGQIPPNDVGSEWAIIASVLAQPWDSKLDFVVGTVQESDFFDAGCRVVFRAICDLFENKLAVDQVSVKSWLDRKNLSGQVDWEDFQQGLSNHSWVGDVAPHVAQVKKAAKLRKLIEACQLVSAEAYGALDEADAFISRAESQIYDAVTSEAETGKIVYTLRESIASLWDKQREEIQAKLEGRTTHVSTGLVSVDNIIGPLRPGLCVIAARPSIGKTALALNICANIAQNGGGAHFVSLETVKETIAGRMVSANAEANVSRVCSGGLFENEQKQVVAAMGRLSKLPVTIDDRSGLNMGQIRASIRRAAAIFRKDNVKLGLVVVDYLQLAKAKVGKNGNREQEVAAVAYGLLEVAKEFNVPVVALSQLNRGVVGRKNSKPQMSDIRESGAIEQAATTIIALHREGDDRKPIEDVEAIVLKSKESAVGSATLQFRGEFMQFHEGGIGSDE